jgi:1-acyl-sn-glycerol-3-phosphate acyltransferase
MAHLSTWARLSAGMLVMAAGSLLWAAWLLLLLPWPVRRARACNAFGKTVCRAMVWFAGCPVTVHGREHLDPARPAIYISNHTSIMDIFLTAWLTPTGTCSIAKRQVLYYPFFGQLYLLSGHFLIDRGHSARAIASMKRVAVRARAHRLSIMLWPEGRRSRDGRLRAFKKGFAHLAVQTGLPIVPIAIAGAHRSWEKNSLRLSQVPIDVTVLPAIDTSAWTPDTLDEHIAAVHAALAAALPEDQRPAEDRAAA